MKKNGGTPKHFSRLVGRSTCMQAVRERAERIARTEATVLIRGESGTGKDLLAEEIHRTSMRADKPYIAVNMAAVPESLIESEIFGHVKGSFTGAGEERQGRFEAANGGTLFIDEIGDLRLTSQAKLLRVLENREVTPVGADRASAVDVRVISATNKPLENMILRRRFREDLYYRLNVVSITMPPLRKRSEDIPLLIDHTLNQLARTYQCAAPRLNEELLQFLVDHPWPGNVRQLRNCIESMFVLATGELLTLDDLPEIVNNPILTGQMHLEIPPGMTLEELKQAAIFQTLKKCDGNRTRTAQALSISVRTLQRKLKQWGFSDADYDIQGVNIPSVNESIDDLSATHSDWSGQHSQSKPQVVSCQ